VNFLLLGRPFKEFAFPKIEQVSSRVIFPRKFEPMSPSYKIQMYAAWALTPLLYDGISYHSMDILCKVTPEEVTPFGCSMLSLPKERLRPGPSLPSHVASSAHGCIRRVYQHAMPPKQEHDGHSYPSFKLTSRSSQVEHRLTFHARPCKWLQLSIFQP
jgi:hypothetical protein